jgi:DNA invertase Pin-like site-specific DNA recombinase
MAARVSGSEKTAAKVRAVSYLRTSSAANVGAEKDSAYRQDAAVMAYAARAGVEVVACFYDAAVSGADPVAIRPGFAAMLAFVREAGISTILVEGASRFARDLIVQETGHAMLRAEGISLIAADDPDAFTADTPTATMIRQILGAVSQFAKTSTVDQLRAARDRRSAALGRRVEGRKGYAEKNPGLVREAKRLRRASPKTGKRRTLAEVAAELARLGHVSSTGKPFAVNQVVRLLAA